ncbi:MAG TPA: DNA mismatch repair protein [Thermoanaerobaculia bacterium]|nr:DNA mismatch repair protein [Thermoanaerobaculia bacterium]
MKIPDLLHREPHLAIDYRALIEVLGMAFLGRELGTQVHDALARAELPRSSWRPEFFANDLFVRDLLARAFDLRIEGRSYPVNREFLFRALVQAPTDLETIRFRQAIVRELDDDAGIRERTYTLYRELFDLLSLLKTPGYQGALDLAAFHLDILRQARRVIDFQAAGFAGARSGLVRLHQAALETQSSTEYRTLAHLLEYEEGMARLGLDLTIGGDGRIRSFAIRSLEELEDNPFHRAPFKRFVDRARLFYRGYSMSSRELMNRLINEVFRQISPSLIPMIQLIGHLEFYLTARAFRDRAVAAGLQVSLPELGDDRPVVLEGLFNPLLLGIEPTPVPTDIRCDHSEPVTLITGPNSGGKTRLLQAIGLTQLLGQSGLYVPARRARLRRQDGLFVSLIEEEGAEQTEGRLGRELVRIRSLFEDMARRSMVILDELCSGTNPSEGVEVFAMVLRLLRHVRPTAFVTTHFLDFARSLEADPVIPGLEFLQVEVDEELRSTYQFVPGVASTSLASVTAQRLGVTFERLAASIGRREEELAASDLPPVVRETV